MGRTRNTATFNLTIKSDSKPLRYIKIFQHYLDEHTATGHSLSSDEQWVDTGMCSSLEVENVTCAANAKAK